MGFVTCHQTVNKHTNLRINYSCIVKLDDTEIELCAINFESVANVLY
jgi:hypothetical protein